MKILDRYLAGVFLKNFLLAVLSMTCLFLFQEMLSKLFEHEFPGSQIVIHQLLNVPAIMVQMMPPAVLLATVFTLSGLTRTNELIACHAIGIGITRIMALILSLVFIVCCFVLIMQDRIVPITHKKQQVYYWKVMRNRPDFFLDIKKDKIWYRSKNLIYNLQLFDPKENAIKGMAVYTFDENFNLIEVVDAKRADYTTNGWKLADGTVTVFNKDDSFPMTQKFDKKDLVINETPRDFQEIEKEVDGLRLKELYRYIQKVKDAGANTKSYEVSFHSKISQSFIPIVMCFLAVPFSLRGRREGGAAKDLGVCLGVTFIYWLFYSISLSLGRNGSLAPWFAAWLPSVVFFAFAGFLLYRQRR
ncbi:MAG: LPS export ABC transporter permease LptG [Bdellovibrionia bacterium]